MPRTHINCIGDEPFGQPRTIQADGIHDHHEVRAGHDAMVAAPQHVATLLPKAAEADGALPLGAVVPSVPEDGEPGIRRGRLGT